MKKKKMIEIKQKNCPDCGFEMSMHMFDDDTKQVWCGPLSTWKKTVWCLSLGLIDLVTIPIEKENKEKFNLQEWITENPVKFNYILVGLLFILIVVLFLI
jgi:hypothetical protein